MESPLFKQCPSCGVWFSRRAIFEDPEVKPIGMSVNSHDSEMSMLFFEHDSPNCGTSFAIPFKEFIPFLGQTEDESLLGTDTCPGHCLHISDLSVCHHACRYAPYRKLILAILESKIGIKEPEPAG